MIRPSRGRKKELDSLDSFTYCAPFSHNGRRSLWWGRSSPSSSSDWLPLSRNSIVLSCAMLSFASLNLLFLSRFLLLHPISFLFCYALFCFVRFGQLDLADTRMAFRETIGCCCCCSVSLEENTRERNRSISAAKPSPTSKLAWSSWQQMRRALAKWIM